MPITILAKNTQSIKKRYRVHSIYTFHLPKMIAANAPLRACTSTGAAP